MFLHISHTTHTTCKGLIAKEKGCHELQLLVVKKKHRVNIQKKA